jgi:dolichol-phosphate mannosyltransferase
VIYICLPVHDEASTLGPVLWKLRKVLTDPEFQRDFHVLVLDDASGDDTPEVLGRYRDHLPLTVIRSEQRLGYGRAVDRLLREAVRVAPYPKRDAAVVLQADFSEDPAHVVDLVKTLEGGADIVAGAHERPGVGDHRSLHWAHRLAPWVLGRTHGGAPVADPLCGFRAYRIVVLKKALREDEALCASPEPWAASLELLGSVARHARRIEDVELGLRYPLHARTSRFKAFRTLRALLGLRSRHLWDAEDGEAA